MDFQAMSQFVGQLGFPIFVAIWLLWKGDQQNKTMVEALNKIGTTLTVLSEKIDELDKK